MGVDLTDAALEGVVEELSQTQRKILETLSFTYLTSFEMTASLAASAERLHLRDVTSSSSESEEMFMIFATERLFESFISDSFTVNSFLLPTFQNLRPNIYM